MKRTPCSPDLALNCLGLFRFSFRNESAKQGQLPQNRLSQRKKQILVVAAKSPKPRCACCIACRRLLLSLFVTTPFCAAARRLSKYLCLKTSKQSLEDAHHLYPLACRLRCRLCDHA